MLFKLRDTIGKTRDISEDLSKVAILEVCLDFVNHCINEHIQNYGENICFWYLGKNGICLYILYEFALYVVSVIA